MRNKGIKLSGVILAAFLTVSLFTASVFAAADQAAPAGEAAPDAAAEGAAAQGEAAAAAPAPVEDEAAKAAGLQRTDPAAPGYVYSQYQILMDADTGVVLYETEADTPMSPASVTKIMTTYLALKNGNLSDMVTMTETGVAMAYSGSSNLYTQVGEQFTLEQLLYGTMIKSANDMATQVAEYIGGTFDEFINMMNEEAQAMGCTNTHFANACGYPDTDNYASARDIAIISRHALELEKFREIIKAETYTIPPTNMTKDARVISNHVSTYVAPDFKYDGCIGGKTGYTDLAMHTLSVFAEKDGRTLIVVNLHDSSPAENATDATTLFDYGFNNFKNLEIENPDFPGYKCTVTVPKDVEEKDLAFETEPFTKDDTEFVKLAYKYQDKEVGSTAITKAEYDLAVNGPEEEEEPDAEEETEHTEFKLFVNNEKVEPEKEAKGLPKSFPELMEWVKDGPNLMLALIILAAVIALICAIILKIRRGIRRLRRRIKRKKDRKTVENA